MEQQQSSSVLKLSGGDNWAVWKFTIEVILKGKGCYDVLSGTAPPAEDEKASVSWSTKDAKAQEIIVTKMEAGPLTHILSCTSAASMWIKLKSVYEKESVVSIHLLQQKFFSMQFGEDSVSTFMSKLEDIKTKLKQAGEPLSEKMIITKILMTLPEKYKHFRSAWESVPIEKQTIEELTSRLLIEEERFDSPNESAVALASVSRQDKDKLKCFTCGKEGHFSRNCVQNKKNKRETRFCHYCKKRGHLIADCKALKSKKKEKQEEVNAFMCSSEQNCERDLICWYMDTGASEHMCCERQLFRSLDEKQKSAKVTVGDGKTLNVMGCGTVELFAWNGQKFIKTVLNNVLYVPELQFNLFSVGTVMDRGVYLVSDEKQCEFLNIKGEVCAIAKRVNKLYRMLFSWNGTDSELSKITSDCKNKTRFETSALNACVSERDSDFDVSDSSSLAGVCGFACLSKKIEKLSVWHKRLCHQNMQHVKSFLKIKGISFIDDFDRCEECLAGKQHRLPFPPSSSRATEILELIHADVCGPFETASLGGSKYFLLLKDDYSGMRTVFFLKHKSEVKTAIKNYILKTERQTGFKVKCLRSDNGLEFVNKDLKSFLESSGIIHQRSVVYTPQQNGRAERDMRTIVEAARSMMTGMQKYFWAEAINTATHILNRTGPSPLEGKSPFEVFYKKDACFEDFRIFGSRVSVLIPKQKRLKLDPKNKIGIFMGYDTEVKGYRVFIPASKKIEVHRDVVFLPSPQLKPEIKTHTDVINIEENNATSDEDKQPSLLKDVAPEERSSMQSNNDQNEVESSNCPMVEEENIGVSSPENSSEESSYSLRPRCNLKCPTYLNDYEVGLMSVFDDGEPNTYDEAISCINACHWKEAIKKELKALEDNDTWDYVKRKNDSNIIDTKWVFRKKKDEKGNIASYKARLVARGFQQDVSYSETFSPVARLTSVRFFLSFCNQNDMPIHQLDVCSAFLYGEINGDVYINVPKGCDNSKFDENTVCKLKKALYGLKDSPRNWNKKFNDVMSKLGFVRCDYEYCLYIKIKDKCKTYLLLYIDDLLISSNDNGDVENVKTLLSREFNMKDLGQICHYLGMHIIQNLREGTIEINQSSYLRSILESCNMLICNPSLTPMEDNFDHSVLKKEKPESQEMETRCRKVIGALMYAMLCSRPDICFAVNILSRYQSCASQDLWNAIKRVLRYIQGTLKMSLVFTKNKNCNVITGFVDSDWAGDKADRKSTGGFVFKLFNCSIAWVTKKQPTVALSSTEAEFVALSLATSEACWLVNLYKFFSGVDTIAILYEDNMSVIGLCKNPQFHHKLKHMDIKVFFIREKVFENKISIQHVGTNDQEADIFTKPLGRVKFIKFRKMLGFEAL